MRQVEDNHSGVGDPFIINQSPTTTQDNSSPMVITVQKPKNEAVPLTPVKIFPNVTLIEEDPQKSGSPVSPIRQIDPGIYPKLQTYPAPIKCAPRKNYGVAIANLKHSGIVTPLILN